MRERETKVERKKDELSETVEAWSRKCENTAVKILRRGKNSLNAMKILKRCGNLKNGVERKLREIWKLRRESATP